MDEKIYLHIDPDLEPLIPGFIENRHADIKKIREALLVNDYDAIRVIAHTMKGVGGGYGFDEVTRIGFTIELAAQDHGNDDIEKLINELAQYLNRVVVTY